MLRRLLAVTISPKAPPRSRPFCPKISGGRRSRECGSTEHVSLPPPSRRSTAPRPIFPQKDGHVVLELLRALRVSFWETSGGNLNILTVRHSSLRGKASLYIISLTTSSSKPPTSHHTITFLLSTVRVGDPAPLDMGRPWTIIETYT